MKLANRRVFMMQLAAGAVACRALPTRAQGAKLDEADPQASSLGYKNDTAQVDGKKFPKHAASQQCGGCALYQGKPGDAWGGCPLFAGKQVSGKGWCSAWAKKA